jgi:integrase
VSEKRRDNKGRILQKGESQRTDGKYVFRYIDLDGTRKSVDSWQLVCTDKNPSGKKKKKPLREQEKEIQLILEKRGSTAGMYYTMNQFFDFYLENKRYKGKRLDPKTSNNYRQLWRNHIEQSQVGKKKVNDLIKMDLVNLYKHLQREECLSYGTITLINKLISAMMNMAIDYQLIERNPTVRVMQEIEGHQKVKEALTRSQQRALLDFAKKNYHKTYLKMLILIHTMCRAQEFNKLTVNDIDFKRRIISINHQLKFRDGKILLAVPKYSSIRSIPMDNMAYKALKEWIFLYYEDSGVSIDGQSGFLFFENRAVPIYETKLYAELKQVQKAYNKTHTEKIEDLSPHTLRHTGCTRRAENGMDRSVLQYLMGHSTSRVTQIYDHVQEERARHEILETAQ